ncbi:hypothetical protein HD806DRAFT_524289 [Xylariaceae sp. AK1471]|nr:hypothetical protein HD806DRAFT_524289 [Xylariaceae sp. AK1471]
MGDYSCYITIKNHTRTDLGLIDFGIGGEGGQWPRWQPLNTIEAGDTGTIQLKDDLGKNGSEGTFRLEFADPTGWRNSNYLRLKEGTIDVYENGHRSSLTSTGPEDAVMSGTNTRLTKRGDSVKANYDIGFDAPGKWFDKYPIHESIVIAALIRSKVYVPRGTNYNNLNLKQWEYARGLIWNDDPSCLLFEDEADFNNTFGDGVEWSAAFEFGGNRIMTRRSHFGDLQFLHSMATHLNEEPLITKKCVMRWLCVMYKLACGGQGVSEDDKLKQHLEDYFKNDTHPGENATLKDLLIATTKKYRNTDIQKRALGSCLHITGDSYAPDTYGRWGPIIRFHTYEGQNNHHKHYDGLPKNQELPIPKSVETFNSIIDSGVCQFLETEVFALDEHPLNSDNRVDQNDPVFEHSSTFNNTYDVEYHAGLQRKLASLDSNVHPIITRQHLSLWRLMTILTAAVLSFLFTLLVFYYFKK